MKSANKKKSHITQRIIIILTIGLLTSTLLLEVSAKHKEFEVEEFSESLTLVGNNYVSIDFNFEKGKLLEIIYTVQVTSDKLISMWFVNQDNFLLFKGGTQFLHYMDGSGQDVSYAKRAVTLTKHDSYKLVLINYNNETLEVNLVGEIRTLIDNSDENSTELSSILTYIFIVIIIILVCLLTVFGFKIRKYKNLEEIGSVKNSGIKDRKKKENKNKVNDKKLKNKPKSIKEKAYKINNPQKNNKPKGFSKFCGYCGESTDTPFCKNCGKKN